MHPGMGPGGPPPGMDYGPPPGMGYAGMGYAGFGYYGEDPYGEYGELEPVGYYAGPEMVGWHGYGEDPYGEYEEYAEGPELGYYGDATYLGESAGYGYGYGGYGGYGRYIAHRPSRFNPSCLVATNLNGYAEADQYAAADAYGESAYGESAYGESEYGESEYGESEYGEADYGESEYGESEYGESEYGESADFAEADAYGEAADLNGYVEPPTVSPRVTAFTQPNPAPQSTQPDPFRPLF
ncbi:hypothetical protein WDZ92_04440 [Nostoc sp. NIES-2111]